MWLNEAWWKFVKDPYGWELQLDLYDCKPKVCYLVHDEETDILESPKLLKIFVTKVVDALDMKTYGEFECPHFGHSDVKTAGLSFKWFIETSLVSGHLSPHRHSAYLNFFSCRKFDKKIVKAIAAEFFNTNKMRCKMRVRY